MSSIKKSSGPSGAGSSGAGSSGTGSSNLGRLPSSEERHSRHSRHNSAHPQLVPRPPSAALPHQASTGSTAPQNAAPGSSSSNRSAPTSRAAPTSTMHPDQTCRRTLQAAVVAGLTGVALTTGSAALHRAASGDLPNAVAFAGIGAFSAVAAAKRARRFTQQNLARDTLPTTRPVTPEERAHQKKMREELQRRAANRTSSSSGASSSSSGASTKGGNKPLSKPPKSP
jgi:hypothetical protein